MPSKKDRSQGKKDNPFNKNGIRQHSKGIDPGEHGLENGLGEEESVKQRRAENPLNGFDTKHIKTLNMLCDSFLELQKGEISEEDLSLGSSVIRSISTFCLKFRIRPDQRIDFTGISSAVSRGETREANRLVEYFKDHCTELLCPPKRTLKDMGID